RRKGHLGRKHQVPRRLGVGILDALVVKVKHALYRVSGYERVPDDKVVNKLVQRHDCYYQHYNLQYRLEPFWYAAHLVASKPHNAVPCEHGNYHEVRHQLGDAGDRPLCVDEHLADYDLACPLVLVEADVHGVERYKRHSGGADVKDAQKYLSRPPVVLFQSRAHSLPT